jgi:hypothetical protein
MTLLVMLLLTNSIVSERLYASILVSTTELGLIASLSTVAIILALEFEDESSLKASKSPTKVLRKSCESPAKDLAKDLALVRPSGYSWYIGQIRKIRSCYYNIRD